MSGSALQLAQALERVAAAMEAETEALRRTDRDELRACAERKMAAIEQLETLLGQSPAPSGGIPSEKRARVQAAARRVEAAGARNARALRAALEATRRVVECIGEAASAASMTGTYGPDGRSRPAAEAVGTVERSA